MFNSAEKYYLLFVIGMIAIGLAVGLLLGYSLSAFLKVENRSIIYLASMLLCGGSSILIAFFTIMKWLKHKN